MESHPLKIAYFFSTVHNFDTLKNAKHSKESEKRLTVLNFLDQIKKSKKISRCFNEHVAHNNIYFLIEKKSFSPMYSNENSKMIGKIFFDCRFNPKILIPELIPVMFP